MGRTLSRTLIALAITTVAVFAADNTLGTWKLNVGKSTYTPGAFPIKSLTVVREASGGGVKVTNTGERSDGPIKGSYTAKYDGSEAHVTGNSQYDSIAIKQVNPNTL